MNTANHTIPKSVGVKHDKIWSAIQRLNEVADRVSGLRSHIYNEVSPPIKDDEITEPAGLAVTLNKAPSRIAELAEFINDQITDIQDGLF